MNALGAHVSIHSDGELSRLRRALDSAIYSFEQIRRRAESGVTSDVAVWDCLVIAEAAEAAIERISRSFSEASDAVRPTARPAATLRHPAAGD